MNPLIPSFLKQRKSSLLLFSVAFLNSCDPVSPVSTPKTGSENSSSGPDGLAVFRQNCVNCHGIDGKLGIQGAKDLTQSPLSLDERILIITNGRNLMAPWGDKLSPAEIRAVAEFTGSLAKPPQ